ncbi:MAG: hypothetical protein ACYC7A_10035 [Thermoanaerobaculia bacterium]
MADPDLALPPQFFELPAALPRQGPGGNAHTRRAFEMAGKLPTVPRIVDVGCGPGMQSCELARLSGAKVYAVDTYAPFLTFPLPPDAWWDDYYAPIESRLPEFRARHAGDSVAQEVADAEEIEIDLFRRYSAYYGYVFYVMRAL